MEDAGEKSKTRWSDAHPAAYAVKTVIISMFLTALISNIIAILCGFAAMAMHASLTREQYAYFGLPGKVVTLILYRFKYRKSLKGFFDAKGLGSGMLLGWSVLAVNAFTLIGGLIDHTSFGNILMAIWQGMQPGFSEEIMFRIIPISLAMRSRKREQLVTAVVLSTSILFGLSHGLNILFGADIAATLMQITYAAGVGLLFAGIYVKTGNMWITILLHSMTDIIYFMSAQAQSSGGVLSQQMGITEVAFLLVYTVLYYANAYYVFKKTKKSEISATWSRIWEENA